MIQTGFESRVKIQQIIDNQLPEFILDESPKTSEFLKQYYISQEYQGGSVDIAENLDQYLKLDNLTPEVIVGSTELSQNVGILDTTIHVNSTKGFPPKYGLFKIDDEIITYTEINGNSFIGCIRGFSGITDYHDQLNPEELVFSQSSASTHSSGSLVKNLSSLFLQEFYKKIKSSLTPGLENLDFVSDLNVGNFIKESRSLYESKGTPESFRILFNVLYGERATVVDLEQFLIKPSNSEYIRREVTVVEAISGNPVLLEGQSIFKLNDTKTSASVSEVETITRSGKTYYKLLLFLGYDDTYPTITGKFNITGSSKVLEDVTITSSPNSVISVDSTIGFLDSGSIYYKGNEILYTSKTINQFLGCYSDSNTPISIKKTDIIRSNEIYYGYENGDTSKKVEFRITGVLSNVVLNDSEENFNFLENDELYPQNLGEIILNPDFNPTRKEIFTNTFIYNSSTRHQIESFSNSTITLKSSIDESNIKENDIIEILNRNTEFVAPTPPNSGIGTTNYGNVLVKSIDGKTLTTDLNISLIANGEYDIRRKLKKATSSIVPLDYGNNTLISDILNVYNENSQYLYVASNSLPSYPINFDIFKYNINNIDLNSYDLETGSYSILEFDSEISIITGDRVYYDFSKSAISGLERGSYYVEVIKDNQETRKIRLYRSPSPIGTNSFVSFGKDSLGNLPEGSHTITLYSQKSGKISAQKILKKFKINPSIGDRWDNYTVPGFIGMLKNGVEIYNYKTNDKIYYGPLENVKVLNGGDDYDVINPPFIKPLFGNASLQPVITGSVKKVYVDPQDFNIDKIVSINLTGGNGKGSNFLPVIERRRKELEFDARPLINGGGLDFDDETITFLSPHNLIDGQELIYDSNNSEEIGVGSYKGPNNDQSNSLKNNSSYFVKVINDKTIELYPTFSNYTSGINTVGFTTVGNYGIQKFKTEIKNVLTGIKVINGGEGYSNRLLRVSQSGISTHNHTINFTDHGFSNGELVTYQYENSIISGLSTSNQYYVLNVDSNSFRLCDAGIGGTFITNYERKNYVRFTSSGDGYQIFNYPKISLEVNYTAVGLGSTEIKSNITATPIVRGKISQVYVYDAGSDYGSTILNVHQRPPITLKNGNSAQLIPIVSNGKIIDVKIQYGGVDYYSIPDLVVYGSGSGALLRPIISNKKIVSVVVVNSGGGYSQSDTVINVEPSGKNAVFQSNVRSLTLNSAYRYGIEGKFYRNPANEALVGTDNNLEYCVIGYSQRIKENVNDDGFIETNQNGVVIGSKHSPIIGWAYDGNPIYGPYAYSDPGNPNSFIKQITTGYSQKSIVNRPSIFPPGYFIEDYEYTENGDLDQYNGRFAKTPEFPNGVYAYYAIIGRNVDDEIIGNFPYFVGNKYRSTPLDDNLSLNQSFDFNNSSLIRNTLPYKVNDPFADYDFIVESNEIIKQKTLIESVTSGSVTDLKIINSGTDYLIGDELLFDDSGTGGGGASANIVELKGKEIIDINTSVTSYPNSLIQWQSGGKIKVSIFPYHEFSDNDNIIISGLTTESTQLNGFYKIDVTESISRIANNIPSYSSTGIVTDIYLTSIPNNISIGSSIRIENEVFKVLNSYPSFGVLRVLRSSSGVAHTQATPVYFLSDSFTIDKKIEYFNSKQNNKIYFNPYKSIGVGTITGSGISTSYNIGITSYSNFIPTQSIFLPNHGFENNEKIILKKPSSSPGITVSNTPTSSTFNLFESSDTSELYVVKKSKDYIGIVTNISTSNGLFFFPFTSSGDIDYLYSIESDYRQIFADITRVTSIVSVSTSHNLKYNDPVSIKVRPNISVGIGTSTSIIVKFDENTKNTIINPLIFQPSQINTSLNQINISSHNLKTGDKVIYNSTGSLASGLSRDSYYVYKIDEDNINLCETYKDSLSNPPVIVNINSTGSLSQSLSLINPQIPVIKNNNLVFNLSDSSLEGYNFKIYYDENFTKEFTSDENESTFSVIGVGTVGVSSTASLTLNFSEKTPEKLYYSLEKSGYISTSDTEVINYSQIVSSNSLYNGDYSINGIGTTYFSISLRCVPEKLSYNQNECDVLEYSTKSTTALGGVNKVKLSSGGIAYKKLPLFNGTNSITGSGLFVLPISKSIGKIKQERVVNEGFEYSSDKTLRPTASIPKSVSITSSNTIQSISVIDGGGNYSSPPELVCVDSDTGKVINSGFIRANLFGSSIKSVTIENKPKGLPTKPVTIRAINNSNGVTIDKVEYSSSGIVTCTLTTPILGFTEPPFVDGEKIFVEGIQKNSSDGDGFNSTDLGYQFFTITNSTNNIPAKLEFNISGFTTNPGIAKTLQDSYANIIKFSDYPKFEVKQAFSPFFVGEKLLSSTGNQFIERDLRVVDSNINFVRVFGSYNLSPNEKIRGFESLSEATTINQNSVTGQYNINYSNRQNLGWKTNSGKLNEDFQVIPDNDYYQNLSYTIKSSKTWEEIVTPVNNILHTSGLKNFSDTEIQNSTSSGIGTTESSISLINEYISENRVDTINNFDLSIDVDVSSNKSKFLRFLNVRLSDYILCKTNKVLEIDDISSEFSSGIDGESGQENILSLNSANGCNSFLIQVRNIYDNKIQFSEIITINGSNDIYTLEKNSLLSGNNDYFSSESLLGNINGYNDNGNFYLRFDPLDNLNSVFDIKILQSTFTQKNESLSSKNIGFVQLINSNKNVPVGFTTSLISVDSSQYTSFYSNIHVTNLNSSLMNYVEVYVTHDGTNSYITESYFDNSSSGSSNFIGSFAASLSLDGVLELNYTNTTNEEINIKSKIVGFGTTSIGIGTYKFISLNQIDGSERAVVYNSQYENVLSSPVQILSLDKTLFSSAKSIVKVSIGNTSALHEVMTVYDETNVYSSQYQFLSIGDESGIGTFGSEISGNNFVCKFYPDPSITGNIEVLSFNESFYKDLDFDNTPENLEYGFIRESVAVKRYYGKNFLEERLDFDLNYNNTPIFTKTFDPSNSSVVELSTGKFTIPNHFFSTGEELIYTPKSSFIYDSPFPMGIGETSYYLGLSTSFLPTKVWAIKDSGDVFRLATKPEYALQGIGVTFTSIGVGNAHELEMYKKNEKSLITINNVAQYPISYTSIVYNLSGNGGQISSDSTIFALSGIGSIFLTDILKIGDEYMRVDNVGFGELSSGPITFNGNKALVEVVRGFLGSNASSHNDGSLVRIYRGSYNIVGNKIFFTEPPRGNPLDSVQLNESNLPRGKSSFTGRVFLRKNYSTNVIYDDISSEFTGKRQTFNLKSQGINTTGIGNSGGNGILFINNIFQTPTTLNNESNNYFIEEDEILGISSITFTGITSSNSSDIYISNFDVNQNQLPRGGIIVSLGSTPGLGYAPLVGASVTAVVSGGSIISVGIGTTDIIGSGYRNPVSIAITDSSGNGASINGIVGAGGTLSFNIISGGSGYSQNPKIIISPPNYENLPVIGVSRLGIGQTTDTGFGLLLNVEVGASSTTVGIGSTLFEVTSFKINRPGYSFKRGDVFTPVGLVTDKNLSSPIEKFELTVLDTFTDSFAAWQFGELDYIDSIAVYQNGIRTRFPLYYNGNLLSFQIDNSDPDSQSINLSSLLVIFINGVLQKSGESYEFSGGTSFTFSEPPKQKDKVDIFFYRGTRGEDSNQFNVVETVKVGDTLQVFSNNNYINNTITQNPRIIYNINEADKVETNLYLDQGIDEVTPKPVYWTKQKNDLIINGEIVSKSRNSLEPQIYPTANIIKDVTPESTDIFVDNGSLFNYENENSISFDAIISKTIQNPISASISAVVSTSGTISSLVVSNGGSGYVGVGSSIPIIISSPKRIGVGIGTRATAYGTVSAAGSITSPIVITNPGFGYSLTSPPQVITPIENGEYELIQNISIVNGFDTSVIGIETSVGIGAPLAIKFTINTNPDIVDPAELTNLKVGYPIYISNTTVGNGVTSINTNNSDIVSVSTSFVNNVYYVHSFSSSLGIITCNVSSNTNVSGIQTTGTAFNPVGNISWGRLSGFTRSNSPISIGVSGYTSSVGISTLNYGVGLSTYPIIQRRGYGLRETGSLDLKIKQ